MPNYWHYKMAVSSRCNDVNNSMVTQYIKCNPQLLTCDFPDLKYLITKESFLWKDIVIVKSLFN